MPCQARVHQYITGLACHHLALSCPALPCPIPWHPTHRQASPGRLAAFEDVLFKGATGTAAGAGEGGGVSAAAAAAAEVPLLAAVWLGTVDGSRLVGVAFLDAATR